MPLITLEVTPDIAVKIRFLAEAGVFGLQDGSVTLFVKGGHLTTTKTEIFSYAKNHELDMKRNAPILQ